MLDLVIVDGKARGIVTRDMVTGKIESHAADAVILATGGYGNVFYLSTNAKGCNVTATWRAHKLGAGFANPCFTQIHPTCIPVSGDHQSKLTLMSESLRNDGRVWVPKRAGDTRKPADIPEGERDYYLERRYPTFGNLVPRDVASRAAKEVCDEGRGVGPGGRACTSTSRTPSSGWARTSSASATATCSTCTSASPTRIRTRFPCASIPAVHYAMGGLWVDYNLMSTIPGLFVLGEANFSDHGANRLGASALMQGLADGYFIIPYTIGNYLASGKLEKSTGEVRNSRRAEAAVGERMKKLVGNKGKRTAASFHRELGKFLWDNCGMARNAAGLRTALRAHSRPARGVLEPGHRARKWGRAEPGAGICRACGGLHGVWRVDVPRCPGA